MSCQPLSIKVYGVKSADIEFGERQCGKESCVDVKNSTVLLISNLVFQINFQAVFQCYCAKNWMRNVGNYKLNVCSYLRPLRLTT